MRGKHKHHSFSISTSLFLLATLFVLLAPSFSTASTVGGIDFLIYEDQTTGSISYNSSGNLVGTNIIIDQVLGKQTPSNSGISYDISGGSFSFTTGSLLSYNKTGNVEEWIFGSGGSITITGGIASLGISDGSTLLSNGSFDYVEVTRYDNNYFEITLVFSTFEGASVISKLASEYGYTTTDGYYGGLNLTFNAAITNDQNHYFTSELIGSGDVITNPVPIPPSVLLLGSSLLGLLGIGARRKRS